MLIPIAISWIILELSKLWWHSRESSRGLVISVHAICAAILAATLDSWLVVPAVMSVLASFSTLEDKRSGGLLGSTFSGLSSYPWQGCAVLSFGLSLGWPTGLWSIALAAILGWTGGLWWISGIRPAHWRRARLVRSRWTRWAYPASLRRLLREPNPYGED